MSRIGKSPVILPNNVKVDFNDNERKVVVTGPNGELNMFLHPSISFEKKESNVVFYCENENDKYQKAIWGTTRSIFNNLVEGVTKMYEKQLELNGVGYKMELKDKLILYIGYSHPVVMDIPKEISLTLEKNSLKGTSINKQILGNFFANVYNKKPCDVYKHKGFKYPGKFYPKKVGKKVAKSK